MERGANYFDTAYGYHNGNSERVMGRVLSRYPRESWLLASKFPGYDVSNIRPDRVEAIFEEQLEKCGVDYFDFYLFHNVYERNVGPYLDPDNRVLEYLLRQKEAGASGTWGFSAHGLPGGDPALPGRLWGIHGVRPAPAQLSGLGLQAAGPRRRS